LEEEMGCRFVHLTIADLIDDQETRLGVHANFLFDRMVLVSLLKRLDQVMGGCKVHGIPLLDRL
jgi:hypothetical protein